MRNNQKEFLMRILILILLLFPFLSFAGKSIKHKPHAAYVKCYSNGIKIFEKSVKDVLYNDGLIIAIDPPYDYALIGDCVIRLIDKNE
jgi:hypothetical protein